MKFHIFFSYLLLLLSSLSGGAAPFEQEFTYSDEDLITAEVSKENQDQLESILTPLQVVDSNIIPGNNIHLNFDFHSQLKSGEAELYINWSRSIDPSLGIQEIIFPFHSFL